MSPTLDTKQLAAAKAALKLAFVTPDQMAPPPTDPAMMGAGGGMPPMDPAMMGAGGGMPPMDPAMMGAGGDGGMPPMGADPAAGLPVDPAAMAAPAEEPAPEAAEEAPDTITIPVKDFMKFVLDIMASAGKSGGSQSAIEDLLKSAR